MRKPPVGLWLWPRGRPALIHGFLRSRQSPGGQASSLSLCDSHCVRSRPGLARLCGSRDAAPPALWSPPCRAPRPRTEGPEVAWRWGLGPPEEPLEAERGPHRLHEAPTCPDTPRHTPGHAPSARRSEVQNESQSLSRLSRPVTFLSPPQISTGHPRLLIFHKAAATFRPREEKATVKNNDGKARNKGTLDTLASGRRAPARLHSAGPGAVTERTRWPARCRAAGPRLEAPLLGGDR